MSSIRGIPMDIYRKYDESKRLLLPVRQKYAGQVGDSLSTTLHFAYKKGFLVGKTVWIVFSVEDEHGVNYAYSEGTTPRFDGYTFHIPYEVTANADGNQIDYQLVFASAHVDDEIPTAPPTFEGMERESSMPDELIIERSLKDPIVLKTSIESSLTDPPTRCEGWIHYFKQYGILLPVLYDDEHILTFQTYNGLPQSITLNNVMKEDFGRWDEDVNYHFESLVIRDGRLFISMMDDNIGRDPLTDGWWKEIVPSMVTHVGPVERDETEYKLIVEGLYSDGNPYRADVVMPFAEKFGDEYLPGIMKGEYLESLMDTVRELWEHIEDDDRHWLEDERLLFERIAHKNQPNGYAGLNVLKKIENTLLDIGNGPDKIMMMGTQALNGEAFYWDDSLNGGLGGISSKIIELGKFIGSFDYFTDLPPTSNVNDQATVKIGDVTNPPGIYTWDGTEWVFMFSFDIDLAPYQLVANIENDPDFTPETYKYPSTQLFETVTTEHRLLIQNLIDDQVQSSSALGDINIRTNRTMNLVGWINIPTFIAEGMGSFNQAGGTLQYQRQLKNKMTGDVTDGIAVVPIATPTANGAMSAQDKIDLEALKIAPPLHAPTHAIGGTDELTPADIGAIPSSDLPSILESQMSFATCSTGVNGNVKTISLPNIPSSIYDLTEIEKDGRIISVKFTNGSALMSDLEINTVSTRPVRYLGVAGFNNTVSLGEVITFVYNKTGLCWEVVSNSRFGQMPFYAVCQTSASSPYKGATIINGQTPPSLGAPNMGVGTMAYVVFSLGNTVNNDIWVALNGGLDLPILNEDGNVSIPLSAGEALLLQLRYNTGSGGSMSWRVLSRYGVNGIRQNNQINPAMSNAIWGGVDKETTLYSTNANIGTPFPSEPGTMGVFIKSMMGHDIPTRYLSVQIAYSAGSTETNRRMAWRQSIISSTWGPWELLPRMSDIDVKLDKDQGSINSGKFMMVDSAGMLTPEEIPDMEWTNIMNKPSLVECYLLTLSSNVYSGTVPKPLANGDTYVFTFPHSISAGIPPVMNINGTSAPLYRPMIGNMRQPTATQVLDTTEMATSSTPVNVPYVCTYLAGTPLGNVWMVHSAIHHWSAIQNKPDYFPPTPHTHGQSEIIDLIQALLQRWDIAQGIGNANRVLITDGTGNTVTVPTLPIGNIPTSNGPNNVPKQVSQFLDGEVLYWDSTMGGVRSKNLEFGTFIGAFDYFTDLPSSANIGDQATVTIGDSTNEKGLYTWDGTEWVFMFAIDVDLTPYQLVSNLVNSWSSPSTAEYPSTKLVSDALALKADATDLSNYIPLSQKDASGGVVAINASDVVLIGNRAITLGTTVQTPAGMGNTRYKLTRTVNNPANGTPFPSESNSNEIWIMHYGANTTTNHIQIAISQTGAQAIRYATSGSWGAWSAHVPSSIEWSTIVNAPTSFTPSAHKVTHAIGGSDVLTPADIGAIPTTARNIGVAVSGTGVVALNNFGQLIFPNTSVGIDLQTIGNVMPQQPSQTNTLLLNVATNANLGTPFLEALSTELITVFRSSTPSHNLAWQMAFYNGRVKTRGATSGTTWGAWSELATTNALNAKLDINQPSANVGDVMMVDASKNIVPVPKTPSPIYVGICNDSSSSTLKTVTLDPPVTFPTADAIKGQLFNVVFMNGHTISGPPHGLVVDIGSVGGELFDDEVPVQGIIPGESVLLTYRDDKWEVVSRGGYKGVIYDYSIESNPLPNNKVLWGSPRMQKTVVGNTISFGSPFSTGVVSITTKYMDDFFDMFQTAICVTGADRGKTAYRSSTSPTTWGAWTVNDFIPISQIGANNGVLGLNATGQVNLLNRQVLTGVFQSNPYFQQNNGWHTSITTNSVAGTPFPNEASTVQIFVVHYNSGNSNIAMQIATSFGTGEQSKRLATSSIAWGPWVPVYETGQWKGYIPVSTSADINRIGTGVAYGGYTWGLNDKYYLTNDIDMTGTTFVPLGPRSSPYFSGILDGNGKKILGLNYNGFDIQIGLFYQMTLGAVVRNLDLEVNFQPANVSAAVQVGGIMGYGSNITIENCVVRGKMGFATGSNEVQLAGVARLNNNCIIRGCKSYVEITNGSTSTSSVVGGVVIAGSNVNTVEDCENYGDLSGTTVIGGISGAGSSNGPTITRCKNYGNITVVPSGMNTPIVGGITSYIRNPITGCANYGYIYCPGAGSPTTIGGICGRTYTSGSGFYIHQCCNYGSIRSGLGTTSSIEYLGGIVGSQWFMSGNLDIVDCFNMGNIYLNSTQSTSTAGGILGHRNTNVVDVRIVNCYSTGKVMGNSASTPNLGSIVGSSGMLVVAVNCYTLAGSIIKNNVVQPDSMTGSVTPITTIDGASTPPRTSIQGSGAKTIDQLRAPIGDLTDGSSIYYQGNTVVSVNSYDGFDFNKIWLGTHGVGSPYLKDIGIDR